MTVMGKEKTHDKETLEDVYRALIAVKENSSDGSLKTIGTGCAVRTGNVFGINWRKKYHLLISSSLLSKDALESHENRGKYIGEFENGKPKLELEKASNTFFKKEHKDFHFIAIGRGRSGKLGHHVLDVCLLERDQVLQGKLYCFVAVVSNEKSGNHSFKMHEIVNNSGRYETTDTLTSDEFPRGAPVLNNAHDIVGIVSRVSDGKKIEICFVSDSHHVEPEPRKTEANIPTVVTEEKNTVNEKSENVNVKRDLQPPEKPQRSKKVNRSQSERIPCHSGTGKDRDLRHSFRYGNRNGYKVYVSSEAKENGVQKWKPKGFGAKKNLFESKEPVKFLGVSRTASNLGRGYYARKLLGKPRPKISSSVSLPNKLNEVDCKKMKTFSGLKGRRTLSSSNILAAHLVKDLPSDLKSQAANIFDDPAKGQLWRKIAAHYGITDVEVNDLAFGASRHISGSETKALFQKLSIKKPELTVSDFVDYLFASMSRKKL